jgi:hypothetical protein
MSKQTSAAEPPDHNRGKDATLEAALSLRSSEQCPDS